MTKKIKKKILVCVAHPDDETLGCGGTIAKHINEGDEVYCLSMTDGVSSRNNYNATDLRLREKSKWAASKILGFKWVDHKKKFPDNQMDKVNLLKIIKFIESAKNKINPSIVYTHFPEDLNIDHRITAEATLTAFRPNVKNLEKILAFEIPSSTDYRYYKKKIFNPNYFVDIKKYWKLKKKALNSYKQELKIYPDSRSIKGIEILSKFRGIQNNLEYAEGFVVLKQIER